ncbi:MAG TPA: glycosyltransferase family 4 protein [Victivallales bacterium]|nr:glycosyltransferase family 4 protein [Victivallales bacterium]
MSKKILFLLKSDHTPSSRIRGLDLVKLLSVPGDNIECQVEYIPKNIFKRHLLFRKLHKYDTVILQKRLPSLIDMHEIRRTSKKLIFDFDDAIYLKNSSPSQNISDYESWTRLRKFKRVVENSDLVVAANRVLAEKAGCFTEKEKIHIIPSGIEVEKYKQKNNYQISSTPVIGWIGTKSTLRYLDMMSEALREIRKRYDFVLRVISDADYKCDGIKVENIRWNIERQFEEISLFDIGIMPLSEDPFSEGKSAYKLLQYLASGVPSVCSPVGMNKDVAGNNEYALTANGNDEFQTQISLLIENCEIREKLGKTGRRMVKEKYDMPVLANLWKKLLL